MAPLFEHLDCGRSLLACFTLACLYVGSLYVWKNDLHRDHPDVIRRRFTSVLLVSALSPFYLWLWSDGMDKTWVNLLNSMGCRSEGLISASVLPLLLTMVLFLGPILQQFLDCPWSFTDGLKVAVDPKIWVICLTDIRWMRNHVVAPLTEELVFRACMLPILVPCMGPQKAVFACPLFFGVAHFHHVIEQLKFKQRRVDDILLSAAFQFGYTSVFGAYTAFLFIRTGHLVGPVLCHAFCNFMGFPPLAAAVEHSHRLFLVIAYLTGALLFLYFLHPMTDPFIYTSDAVGLV
uniref:CAAX prenyl protease 2 n=1 Tax=Eptatretus burgeri TaxID=7764 RepID=A0A8C4X1I7_EPTBU